MSSQPRHSIGPHPDLPTIAEDLLESEEEDSIADNIIIDDNQSDSGSKVSYANSYAFTLDGVGFDEENSLISGICNGSVVNHRQEHLTPPQNNRGRSARVDSNGQDDDDEKELQHHRDACRKLGIPWSSAHSDSDQGSEQNENGTTATPVQKSGLKMMKWPWPDMAGMMSTPPTLDTLDEDMRDYALSNTGGAKKRRGIHNNRWNVKNGFALIATVVLVVICIIGIMVTAFTSTGGQSNVEAEVVVMDGQPRPKVVTTGHDVQGSLGSVSAEKGTHKTKAAKEVNVNSTAAYFVDEIEEEQQGVAPPTTTTTAATTTAATAAADCITAVCNIELSNTCFLKYKLNTSTSVTPVHTITFELVCEGEAWLGIGFSTDGQMIGSEAVLGMPGGVPQKYVLGGKDSSSVMPMAAHKQTLIDATIQVTKRGLTVMKFTKIMKEDGEVEIKSGENILLYAQGMGVDIGHHVHVTGESFFLTLPDLEETEEAQATDTTTSEQSIVEDKPSEEAAANGQDSSCIDQTGKFKTSKNKNRSCRWMLKSGDTLHSNLQDRECGIQALGTQASELGLNCRHTCRAYNGCILNDIQDESIEVDGVQPPQIDGGVDVDDFAGIAAPCTIDVCNIELSHTCFLKYKLNTPTSDTPYNTITFELVCEGEAWLGIGFSTDGQMIGSEAVMSVPGGVPQKYVLGGKDNSSVMPMAAHKQTLIDASMESEDGMSVLKFTKIMKEDGEVEIKSGENILLYAQGMGVDIGYHVTRESFTLSLSGVEEEESVAVESSNETPLATNTFIDASKGLLRSCSWLDIRNWERRQIRRDANCHDELTQASCPTSCSAYVNVNEVQGSGNTEQFETIINKPQDIQLMREQVPPPLDDCVDTDGYFLDSNSTVRKCDWLNTNPDPLDETRKINNCGYLKEPTDLGRMCKLSCGMCGW